MVQQPQINKRQTEENIMSSSLYKSTTTKWSTKFNNIVMFEKGLLSNESRIRLESLNRLLELNGISYEDYFKIKTEIFLKEIN
ncbi:MAG: hypothetical protein ACRCWU_01950 [Metamycoplasmataceae bacterium]